MPFHKNARITVENKSNVTVESFYFNIDIRTYDELPDESLYFHAQFRKLLTLSGQPVTILETTGRGHYVGTLLSMQPETIKNYSYLEGDEQIFIDGESIPGITGTGTEDYFSSGWYYDTGEYSAPYHGATFKDEDCSCINSYRWHIEDPIPFKKSFLFQIEHGAANDSPSIEYSSVAYWYQTHPHPIFPPLPESLLPLSEITAPSIEAEQLINLANFTGGELRVQNMSEFEGNWGSDMQLWWVEAKPGDRLTLPIDVPKEGSYEIIGFFTRAPNYGIIRLIINGKAVGSFMDGYAPEVEPTGPVFFGRAELHKGINHAEIELAGKDARSSGWSDGYVVGIDGFLLRE
jgi:hypothetical protein